MKKLIGHDTQLGQVLGSYSFNPSTNTLTIIGLSFNLALEQLLLITDATAGITIFQFNISNMNGSISNNVITLDYNCSALSATDALQIYVDVPDTSSIDNASMNEAYTHLLLQKICDLLEPMATQDQANRQRVTLDALTAGLTLTTVGTVSALTGGTITTITNPVPVGNIATLGGGNPEWQYMDSARQSYDTLRSKLAFGN